MKRKQGPKETAGGRVRLTVYLPKDMADEVRGILDDLPMRVSVSSFLEAILKDALPRVRAEGIKLIPRK